MDRMVVCNAVAILAIRRLSTYQRLLSVTQYIRVRTYDSTKIPNGKSPHLYIKFSHGLHTFLGKTNAM